MGLNRALVSDVAYAPSNVKDAAAGKSFTFIAIVVRNGMGTLVRAAPTLVSSPGPVNPLALA